jgi:hypothetical protein
MQCVDAGGAGCRGVGTSKTLRVAGITLMSKIVAKSPRIAQSGAFGTVPEALAASKTGGSVGACLTRTDTVVTSVVDRVIEVLVRAGGDTTVIKKVVASYTSQALICVNTLITRGVAGLAVLIIETRIKIKVSFGTIK